MDDGKILFKGEMQLLGWQETHSAGAKVTLQLADADALEPFKLMTVRKGKIAGQRLMVVMVEIGDDEQPVHQDDANAMHQRKKGGALSILAGQWCGTPHFQGWLQMRHRALWAHARESLAQEGRTTAPHEVAAQVIRATCCVGSRAELDHDATAAQRFHTIFRLPYGAVLEEAGAAQ